MPVLHFALLVVTAAAVGTWALMSAHVLTIRRRRTDADAIVAAARATLDAGEAGGLSVDARSAALGVVMAGASRELVMRTVIDPTTPSRDVAPLAQYLVDRWGADGLQTDAAGRGTGRDTWRRKAALRILFGMQHPRALDLLARAVDGDDADVASVAISILAMSPEREPAGVLVRALQSLRQSPSELAAHLDRTPAPVADDLRALLDDPNPVVRQWAAALLGRFPQLEGLETTLCRLTSDADPRVRKAAIASLGAIGDQPAADAAQRLLADSCPFVRAAAARAVADLDRLELAAPVAALLGDSDWWVRRSAKEALVAMGTDVWPIVVRCLGSSDRFARNGAAEVVQNLGLLDSLVVMEAATDYPASSKLEMLRHIAEAGEVRFTESLVERAGPIVGPRLRNLLTAIGLAHVGAA